MPETPNETANNPQARPEASPGGAGGVAPVEALGQGQPSFGCHRCPSSQAWRSTASVSVAVRCHE